MLNFEGSIVRCQRCRTYINAYVMFTDGGRRWRCNVCAMLNEGGFEAINDVISLEAGGQEDNLFYRTAGGLFCPLCSRCVSL